MTQTAVTEDLKKALASEEGGRRWLRRLAIGGVFVLVLGAAGRGEPRTRRTPGEVRDGHGGVAT